LPSMGRGDVAVAGARTRIPPVPPHHRRVSAALPQPPDRFPHRHSIEPV
jgi:hypothetical protein